MVLISTQRLDGYDGALIEDCKKYLGIAPYNTSTNVVAHDPYFCNSLTRRYGAQSVAYVIMVLKRGYLQ